MGYDAATPFKLKTKCNYALFDGIELFFSRVDGFFIDEAGDFAIIYNGSQFFFTYQDENIVGMNVSNSVQPVPKPDTWTTIIDPNVESFSLDLYEPSLEVTEADNGDILGVYAPLPAPVLGYAAWGQIDGKHLITMSTEDNSFEILDDVLTRIATTGENTADVINFVPVSANQDMYWTNGVVVEIAGSGPVGELRYYLDKQNLSESSPYVTVKAELQQ